MLRNLWLLRGRDPDRPLTLVRRLVCSSACCSSFAGDARDLLQQPGQLMSPSQLNRTELESLAFILGLKEELYRSFAQHGPEAYAGAVLGKLEAGHKQALVQKLVAVSGVEATPLLLAWANEQISSAIKAAVQTDGSSSQAWYPELLALAQAWQARQPSTGATAAIASTTELQCIQAMLQTPGALRWDDWLGLPSLDSLLQEASSAQPLLASILQHLGIVPQDADAKQDDKAAKKPTTSASQLQALNAGLAKQEIALKRELASALGVPSTTSSLPADLLSRAANQATAAPAVALALLQIKLVQYLRLSLGITPTGQASALLRVLRCPRGQGLTGVETPSMDPSQLKAAAKLLLEQATAKKQPLPELLAQSHSSLHRALVQVAGQDQTVAKLLQSIQAWRAALLVSSDPWLVSTASMADLDALTVEQFNQLNHHAQAQNSVGSQLYSHVFGAPPETAVTAVTATSHKQVDADVLASIYALPAQDRAALAWVILRSTGLATAATSSSAGNGVLGIPSGSQAGDGPVGWLLQGFARYAAGVQKQVGTAHTAAQELSTVVRLERQMAELDLLTDRSPPPLETPPQPGEPGGPLELPPAQQLNAARAQLPESQLLLFDLLHQDLTSGTQAPTERLVAAFNAVLSTQASVRPAQLLDTAQITLPESLTDWLNECKQQLVGLSPAALALLSHFLTLRLSFTKAAATDAQHRLKALLAEVQAAAAKSAEAFQGADSQGDISPYWSSPKVTGPRDGLSDALGGQGDLPSPQVVAALLGAQEGAQFEAWLKAQALANIDQQGLQPYELLDDTHDEMDRQRYLTMEHDPQLHMVWETAPRPWSEAGPLTSPDQYLDHMRPLLDKYLKARGLPALLDAEWTVYSEAALAEFAEGREAHEAALRSQGHSTFFNSKAESVYLRQLLAAGIPSGAPLHEQAERYLGVLEANATWTFAQRKRVVQRLIELSQHFKDNPPTTAQQGSPFAPLFTGASSLVPKLTSWRDANPASLAAVK